MRHPRWDDTASYVGRATVYEQITDWTGTGDVVRGAVWVVRQGERITVLFKPDARPVAMEVFRMLRLLAEQGADAEVALDMASTYLDSPVVQGVALADVKARWGSDT